MYCAVKREPFSDLKNIQEDFNRIFTGALPRIFNGEEVLSGAWSPRVDVFEDQNSIVIEADLPGVKPEDFKLSIENFKLSLTGERKIEGEKKSENWHRVERRYGSFTRTFSLPTTVNVEAVKADFRDGVLRVTLPKREEVKPRHIEVKIGDGARNANLN